ncbi:MAG: hypothetical protein WCI03_09975 [bacterium]
MTNAERDANEVMEMKLRCVSLILDCPLNRNATSCPFHRVRQEESVATRVNWVKSLDAERLTGLLARHEKCIGGKREKIIRPQDTICPTPCDRVAGK